MNQKLLTKLLRDPKEKDWFDFKRKLKLYQSDGKLVETQRDELLKDILGLANGNSQIVRKTKYLIVGADDKKFDETGVRILHNVDYKTPSQSELTKWLSSASSPTIAGLECETVLCQGVNLFIITIPPTFNLHETTRELNAKGHFNKHTVFMRQDEHTVPASVRDGVTIQQLKHLYREEIANPSSIRLGVIIGAIVAFMISGAKITIPEGSNLSISDGFVQTVLVTAGGILGAIIGMLSKQWHETRYDFRYMTWREKIFWIVVPLLFWLIYTTLK